MTQVTYFRDVNAISVECSGHAGYADIGSDIVCSAISILIQTLADHLESLADYYDTYMDNGYMWIYAKGDAVELALDVILTGFNLLEENYPDYISVQKGCTLQTYPIL